MNREQYLLCKLAEEASEVAQIALKTQQFGLDEVYEDASNKERCHQELNDLLTIVTLLNEEFDFGFTPSKIHTAYKRVQLEKYYDFSVSLGEIE